MFRTAMTFHPYGTLCQLRRACDAGAPDLLHQHLAGLDRPELHALIHQAATMLPMSTRRAESMSYPDSELGDLICIHDLDGPDAVARRINQLTLTEIHDVLGYAVLCMSMERNGRLERDRKEEGRAAPSSSSGD